MANKVVSRKITKASKRRLLTAGLFCVFLFLYFCFTVFSYTYKIISLKKEEKNLTLKLEQLNTDREYLLVEIEKLQDPDYIARYARETYYYTKDGEYVLKLDKDRELLNDSDEQIDKTTVELNNIELMLQKYKYIIIGGIAIFGVVLTFIIIKSKI